MLIAPAHPSGEDSHSAAPRAWRRGRVVWRRSCASAAAGLVGVLGAALGGCNIVGPAAYFIAGPEKVPAVYTLPKDRATVFFVDDRASRLPQRNIRELIGQTAEEALLSARAATNVIKSRAVQAVVSRERFGKPMGIAEVGRAVEAEVVIYAEILAFGLSPDGQTYAPSAQLRIKVVDAVSRARLFPPPEGEPWFATTVTLPPQQGNPPATVAERQQAELALGRVVGLSLAQLFFEHEQTERPEKLDERGLSR